jgi:2-succinyl-6-hydroxy-2,4-cyclohexadiene-1-carboxylate synthase
MIALQEWQKRHRGEIMRPAETLNWRLPGASLHGETRGGNPTAVFLHGFGGSLSDWDGIWDHLDPAISAIRYDQRGFGQSRPGDDQPFAHADDLLALLDAQGMEHADLIGMSMGGSIAIQFALDHPGRVRRLVLISTGLMGWDWSDEWRTLWRGMTSLARAGNMDEARQCWFDHPLFKAARADPHRAAHLKASIAGYSGAEWVIDHQRPVMPAIERLSMLTPPTLLLSGTRDMPDFRLIADLITASAPDVTRIDYPAHGHMLTLEAPIACTEAISPFLLAD